MGYPRVSAYGVMRRIRLRYSIRFLCPLIVVCGVCMAGAESPARSGAAGATVRQQRDEQHSTPAAGEAKALDIPRLLDALDMPPTEKAQRAEELKDAIRKLGTAGDAALGQLTKRFESPNASLTYRQNAILAMKEIGSPPARATILDVALRKTSAQNPGLDDWAARAYTDGMTDKRDAAVLLDSTTPAVQRAALRAMKGVEVDAALLPSIANALKAKDLFVVQLALEVLAADPSDALAPEKADAVLAAVKSIAERKEPLPVLAYLAGDEWSLYEATYMRSVQALAVMRGVGPRLTELTPRLTGVQWRVAIIARGQAGDATVKPFLTGMLKDQSETDVFRLLAADAMTTAGSREDLSLLNELARADPLVRKRHFDVGPVSAMDCYLVREAAERGISAIEKREQKPQPQK